MGIFDSFKNYGIEKFAGNYIAKYADLKALKIDKSNRSILLEVQPKGELDVWIIKILEYKIVETSGKTYITVLKATSSRTWLNDILNDFMVGKNIEVPQQYVSYLNMAL